MLFQKNINYVFLSNKRTFICLSIFLTFIKISQAQSPNFSYPFGDRILLNPALAGSTICPELNINYKNTYFNNFSNFNTSSFSYDRKIDKISGGLGFHILNDSQFNNTINTISISSIYSYHLKTKIKYHINFAFEISYIRKQIKPDKLIFSNMINPYTGTIDFSNSENISQNTKQNIDFSVGMVYYSKKYFSGFAIHHINSLFDKENNIFAIKYSAYFGKRFSFTNFDSEKNEILLLPNIIVNLQYNYANINYGIIFKKSFFSTGIWLKHNQKIHTFTPIFLVELNIKRCRISYTYDIQFSKYVTMPIQTNELSMSYLLNCGKKIDIKNTIYCPNF